jgi:U3 small nucleolar RNA-associated protein MPP10
MKFDVSVVEAALKEGKFADRPKMHALIKQIYWMQQQILPSEKFAEIWGLEGLDEDQLWGILSIVNEEVTGKVEQKMSQKQTEKLSEGQSEELSEELSEEQSEEPSEEQSEELSEGQSEELTENQQDQKHQQNQQNLNELNQDQHSNNYLSDQASDFEESLQRALDKYQNSIHHSESESDDDDDNLEASDDSSLEGKDAKFKDFFSETEGPEFDPEQLEDDDSNQQSPIPLNLDSEDEDDNNAPPESGSYSSFEKQQAKLAAEISRLEQENISTERPWTLRGEIQAASRPMDSLLEVDVEFENATKPIPVITKEHCDSIEALIIQRIKDGVFDDPVRKVSQETYSTLAPSIELNMQKSTQSLAEIYESDQKAHSAATTTNASSSSSEQHKQIKSLFATLSAKLDALCNYHQMPRVRASKEEVVIVSQAPAVTLEESVPATASNAALLAPQEIHPAPLKMPGSWTEQSKTQKRLLAKKAQQRKRQRMNSTVTAKQKAVKELSKQRNVTLGSGARMQARSKF